MKSGIGGVFLKSIFDPRGVFKTRNLAVMALMVAFSAALSALEIYVDPTQKVYSFSYLPRAMAALAFGPWAAVIVAFVSDFVSFLTRPQYGYFIGYALSAITVDFTCALFLYKREITAVRVVLWRVVVLAVVVFGMNGVWQVLYLGTEPAKYFTLVRVARNLLQFPFDVYLVVTLGRQTRKLLSGAWR